jgi:iron complex outermembrane receptor protein
MQIQLSYTKFDWRRPDLAQPHQTFDFDFQHRFRPKERHELLWGGGYRMFRDETANSFVFSFTPASVSDSLYSGFLQDEIELKPDRLFLTAGAKLERNDYTGVEISPTLRLLWTPNSRQSVWAALTRSVGLPGRAHRHIRLNLTAFPLGPNQPAAIVAVFGQPEIGASSILAYEVGYRNKQTRRIALDITAFRNRYGHLAGANPEEAFPELISGQPHQILPVALRDTFTGPSLGAETVLEWKPAERWSLSASHSVLSLATRRNPGGGATSDGRPPPSIALLDGTTPRHQGQLRSSLDLPRGWEWDSTFHAAGALSDPHVAGYGRIDTRLGWRGRGGLAVSFAIQNLLDRRHVEFLSEDLRLPVERKRSGYAKITWSF